MALSIFPAVDKWLYQTEAFTIVFRAFDDNGNACTGEHLSIQYNITYDGTMPDLTTLTHVDSDASGLIVLAITRPCVISLYGTHSHDINDPSKGQSTQEICINYEIAFQPVVLNMMATYTGPDVEITNNYDSAYLIITAQMSDGSTKTIPASDCIIDDYQITTAGTNIKTAKYIDPVADTVWELEFAIIGVPKLLSLDAQYIGEMKILGDRIFVEEVKVYGTFLISLTTTEEQEILPSDWFFIDIPVVTEANEGIFRIGYKDVEATISVPYEAVTSLRLNVWYEGDKIEVGESYDPNNVVVYLVYPSGERRRISWRNCVIDSYQVTQEGWNWFTITYTLEFKKVTQQFPVEGIIYKDYVDLDFKVLYISNRQTYQTEDVTEEFETNLKFEGILYIDWTQFLKVVNLKRKYGLYIVTVPKLSGLSNQYDTDWEVLCINETTLKATIKKIYNEEEENHGEEDNVDN